MRINRGLGVIQSYKDYMGIKWGHIGIRWGINLGLPTQHIRIR